MARPKLHLDADASNRRLQKALLERGHDVTPTPCEWIVLDASDERQLLESTARTRCIITHNISDFMSLAQIYPAHGGMVLAQQSGWRLSTLIAALDRMLLQTEASEWPGTVRWLNDWRE